LVASLALLILTKKLTWVSKNYRQHFRMNITARLRMKQCRRGKKTLAQLYETWEDNF
jgi:hypothetical protein